MKTKSGEGSKDNPKAHTISTALLRQHLLSFPVSNTLLQPPTIKTSTADKQCHGPHRAGNSQGKYMNLLQNGTDFFLTTGVDWLNITQIGDRRRKQRDKIWLI